MNPDDELYTISELEEKFGVQVGLVFMDHRIVLCPKDGPASLAIYKLAAYDVVCYQQPSRKANGGYMIRLKETLR